MEYSAAASNVRPLTLAYQHDLLRTASGDVHPAAYHSSGASHPPDVSAALRRLVKLSLQRSAPIQSTRIHRHATATDHPVYATYRDIRDPVCSWRNTYLDTAHPKLHIFSLRIGTFNPLFGRSPERRRSCASHLL